MNPMENILPDDPRLTAYALNEMEPAERAAFESLLQHDAAARAAVAEIAAAAGELGLALAHEPLHAVETPGRQEDGREVSANPTRRRAPVLRFPQLYYVTAGLAAASFAVVFVMRQSTELAEPSAVRHVAAETGAFAPPPAAMADRAAEGERAMGERKMMARAARAELPMVAAGASAPDRFFATAEATTSTFPLRVGRESYAQVRDQLRRGLRPARETVHVAEMINAFNYTWPAPAVGEDFATLLEETAAPWAPGHRLVRVGLKALGDAGAQRASGAQVRVDFNPARVRAWRLIGFEHDGAEVGVQGAARETLRGGDSVTALYEVIAAEATVGEVDPTMLTLALSYRDSASGAERKLAQRFAGTGAAFAGASEDMKFIAAVAAFGLALRESPQQPALSFSTIADWALAGAATDPMRVEFATLMRGVGE